MLACRHRLSKDVRHVVIRIHLAHLNAAMRDVPTTLVPLNCDDQVINVTRTLLARAVLRGQLDSVYTESKYYAAFRIQISMDRARYRLRLRPIGIASGPAPARRHLWPTAARGGRGVAQVFRGRRAIAGA
eukprot:6213159-Pleurochrysis_carterae.AAC.5